MALMKNGKFAVATLVASTGLAAPAGAQVIEWDNAAGGDWNVATNWNPTSVPVPGETASIGLPGIYDIVIRSGANNIAGLLLTNPNATIGLGTGRDFMLTGSGSTIDGAFIINDQGGTSGSRLLLSNAMMTLGGTGQIILNDTSPTAVGRAQIVDAVGGITTTFGPALSVRGSGTINATFVNAGTIRADAAGRELAILGSTKTNDGTVEATDGGLLRLATQISQGPTGRIVADGGEVRLISTIVGGEVDASNGLFEVAGGSGNLNDLDRFTGDIEVENGRDLVIRGGLTMDGQATINRDGSTTGTRLLLGTSGTLDGDMTITLNDTSPTAIGRAQIADLVGGLTTTLASTVTIQGSGQVNANLVNDGAILANASGRELAIIGTPKTNNGTIQATGGGLLRVATQINQGPTGRIIADGGEVRLISTIAGGQVDASNGLFEIAGGSGNLNDIDRFIGDIELENGRDLVIRGGLTMDGELIVNRDGSTTGTRLLMGTSGTLEGDMTITLNDTSPSAIGRAQFADIAGGQTTTLASTVLLRGSGQLNANIINEGTIRANADGLELAIIGTAKTNNATIEATGGGLLRLATQINQGPTGQIIADGGEVRLISTIAGGQIDATTGLFEVAGGSATIDNVDQFAGTLELENGRDLSLRGDLTLDGTIVVNRDGGSTGTRVLPLTDGTIDGAGEIFLNDSLTTGTAGRAQFIQAVGGIETILGPGIALTGNGRVNGRFQLQGIVSPGKAGAAFGQTGEINLIGPHTWGDASTTRIQVGGRANGEFDRITGSAAITVDGAFEAEIIDGFVPDTCENFVVISGSSVSGTFDTFVPPPVASNIRWRLFYSGTSVDLRATCVADIDGDCTLTVFDFLAFQNLFAAGSVEADFDGDGALSIFDFLAYQNAFAAGCS